MFVQTDECCEKKKKKSKSKQLSEQMMSLSSLSQRHRNVKTLKESGLNYKFCLGQKHPFTSLNLSSTIPANIELRELFSAHRLTLHLVHVCAGLQVTEK